MIFPPGFIESLEACDGFNSAAFRQAHEQTPPVSVRVNPQKPTSQFDRQPRVPWCNSGFYLDERPSFTSDPLFHAGTYYVQEASSMFLEFLLKQVCDFSTPFKILDLCAAPGGKSTLIAGLLNNSSLLVSNEVIRSRIPVLNENIIKCGSEQVVVTNNDASDFALAGPFDVIVVDAPCSGSGLFRKDNSAVNEWNINSVLHCSRRQSRILEDVLPALAENGILIYSTCSYSVEENEHIVNQLVQQGGFEFVNPENKFPGIIQNESGFRFYPDKIRGEGFFISALRKTSSSTAHSEKNQSFKLISTVQREILSQRVNNPGQFEFIHFGDRVHAIRNSLMPFIINSVAGLKIINMGIEAGKFAGNEFIPAHALPMSHILRNEIPAIELNEEDALQYLRKNPLRINTDKKGWCLARFKGFNLGWLKIIPGRLNNYYPTEWRIRFK